MVLEKRKEQFNRLLNKRYLFCVDFEATCCDKGTIPRDEMEIIEFGGILLDREKGWGAVAKIEFFIEPMLHPNLTDFCKGLTKITQDQVDMGWEYARASEFMEGFNEVYGSDYTWCSWGEFDKNIAVQNGKMHSLPPLLPPETHFNLKVWYSSLNMTKRGFGLDGAVRREGLEFLGQHHRALSDAENVAQIFRRLVQR